MTKQRSEGRYDGLSLTASIRYHEIIDPPAQPEGHSRRASDEASMSKPVNLGGIIPTCQKYDPVRFPNLTGRQP